MVTHLATTVIHLFCFWDGVALRALTKGPVIWHSCLAHELLRGRGSWTGGGYRAAGVLELLCKLAIAMVTYAKPLANFVGFVSNNVACFLFAMQVVHGVSCPASRFLSKSLASLGAALP